MRTMQQAGVAMQFPDEIGFIFNPCKIYLTHRNLAQAAVTVTDGTTTQEQTFEASTGKIRADIRAMVQSCFDGVRYGRVTYGTEASRSGVGKEIEVSVEAMNENNAGELEVATTFEFTVFYIWGALAVGEFYNGYRTLTYFRGYPFTVGLYNDSPNGVAIIGNDGVATNVVNLGTQGVFDVPLTPDTAKGYYTITDFRGTLTATTFDDTYDMTFRKIGDGTYTEKVRINIVDGMECGVYLRWINRHGFTCYHLFKAGDRQHQVTSSEDIYRNELADYDEDYGYQYASGHKQNHARQDVLPVCAPLVDRETWDYLLDAATSPIVDMFMGYDTNGVPRWQGVRIQAGTYTKTSATLQDFALNILLPETPIQSI